MLNKSYTEPVYLISMVAEILDIHPQTLRQYEREGLISPSRTNGRIRLYSQEDIDNIKTVLHLTRNLGVNLSGVDIILKKNKIIAQLQKELEEFKAQLNIISSDSIVPSNKALVIKKSQYDIVIFKE